MSDDGSSFERGETVTIPIEVESATYRRIELEAGDVEPAEWILAVVSKELSWAAKRRNDRVDVDVEIDADTWERIRLLALARYQTGKDIEDALIDAIDEHVQTWPVPVVDGEAKTAADLAPHLGVDAEDEEDDRDAE